MDWQAWLTIAVVVGLVAALARGVAAPDLVFMAGLVLLAAAGVLTPEEAFSGFANPAVATIAALFAVSAGLRETGALDFTLRRLLPHEGNDRRVLARLCPPLALVSGFLNNAPIVAMMTPVLRDWARQHGRALSRFLIPLSYATILGSTLTLIGTSVNLTVDALVRSAGMPPLGFFEFAGAGVPIAIAGLVYLLAVAPRLLPTRRDPGEAAERREYTAELRVESDCPLVGRTVEEAGLRHLKGLFLVEIDRGGRVLTPVGPDETLEAGDRLVFVGVLSTLVDLQRIRGLVPVSHEAPDPRDAVRRRLAEAVISPSSPLVRQSIRDAKFRTVYDAAVVAVHRNGERVAGKIGDIVLQPGDTLLLQTAPGFLQAHRGSRDFYLVSEVPDSEPPRHELMGVSIAILAAMVICSATGFLPTSVSALLAAGALLLTRCLTGPVARRSIEVPVLVVIAAGLGIARAMQQTGAAHAMASVLVEAVGGLGPLATLTACYLGSLVLAETLHHNAGVAIMFPIAVAAAGQSGADPRGFVMAVAFGSACAFASPVTYQTHLIVYGPGGYRFGDFVRVGLPLDLLCAVVALSAIPVIWPL